MSDSKNGEVPKKESSGIIVSAPGPHFLRPDIQLQGRTQSSPAALPTQPKSAGGKRKSKKRSSKKKRRARKSKKNKK
jgi:hypothetical protein